MRPAPPRPHLPSLLSRQLPAAALSEWCSRLHVENFSVAYRIFLGSLCAHMLAEKARCLGMIWLDWPCG